MTNPKKINAWNISMAILITAFLLVHFFRLVTPPTTFLIAFGIGIVLIRLLKPVYEIYSMDFNLSLESIELKELFDELNS